uniref:Uncharacterized protein n=1 Tax=Vitiosangium cumulatum TaxID=1867796 RepID=A0A7D5BDB6_9BACT|nr:hypothetical protein [Vitiosangium cumulatum]
MSEQENKGGGHITASMSDREQVEKTADRLRDELLLTLEELERRRERAMDVRYQLRHALEKNRDLILKAGGVALALALVGVGYSWWRARHREELLWKHRAQALRRAWEHPDRVASHAEERPVAIELGRKLVLIFATTLASAMAKSAVHALVPPSPEKSEQSGRKRLGLGIIQSPARA